MALTPFLVCAFIHIDSHLDSKDDMIRLEQKWILRSEIFMSWLVLFGLLSYTYVELVEAPYIGFNYNASTGSVLTVYAPNADVHLQRGDKLESVNGLNFDTWRDDLSVALFPPVEAGETLLLEVMRDDQVATLEWSVPGFNWKEFSSRAMNAWWIGYLFWLTGLATLLFVRPLDRKRSLFAAFFFLTALWLVVGNTSRWGISESRIFYRLMLCLSMPVMLHLHWLFPRSLRRLPVWVLGVVYGAAFVLCLLYLTGFAPPGIAALVFAFGLVGSLVLLLIHYWRQPEVRAQVRLLFYALLFAIIPIVAMSLNTAFRMTPLAGTYSLAALPIIPGAYFFSIYRYQLGGSEFRANRLIAVYLFLILLGTGLLLISAMLSGAPGYANSAVLWSTLLGVAAALITLYGFPAFQRLVERRLLAMPLPPIHLLDTYLARITTTLNEPSLVHLLKDEVLPTLLVRESALLRVQNHEATTLYNTGEELSPATVSQLLVHLRDQPVYRVLGQDASPATDWVRLGLALQVEGKLIGVWLLGRHDPDDLYSPIEIATLQTLARQTALALANIEQATQLQALYQASIERQELERMKMAHFLHDAILNQAAHLYMSLEGATLSPRVEDAYAKLKEHIHQMVSNLRPPSLDLGLDAALEELATDLEQRAQAQIRLRLDLADTELAYPPNLENHLFRIVQQACENAHRHAQATLIEISGTFAPNRVELMVTDDGTGFVVTKPINMTDLLAHKHFGLVHMMERAEHIQAELVLESAPGQGTRVHLLWVNHEPIDA